MISQIVIGNKATNLETLRQNGFRVPVFFTLGKYETEESVNAMVRKKIPGHKFFAIRSSSLTEDTDKGSRAGYYYSAVGVRRSEIYSYYKKVTESLKEDAGAVIIQTFIPTSKAGVIFTNLSDGQSVINSNFGLCKQVVEGNSCDEYIINNSGKVLSRNIEKEKVSLVFKRGQILNMQKNRPSLTPDDIVKLQLEAARIENLFGSPQDIEWGFYKGKLYILQSRPVTRKLPLFKESEYFDSANIAESYSGIVLPLTISFAAHIYKVVYQNLIISSGAPRRKVESYPGIFNNMVDSFHGRLYYNMNNWYKMTSFIPGYSRNKSNLEDMITSNVREDLPLDILPSAWLKIKYPFLVIFKVLLLKRKVKGFKNHVDKLIRNYRNENISLLNYNECIDLWNELNQELLSSWHIPVENDFMVMTFFGALKKKLPENELNRAVRFRSETGKQLRALINLKETLFHDPEIKDAIENGKSSEFLELIEGKTEIKAAYSDYFSLFGGRFANELKLESSDIEEDPAKFIRLLHLYSAKTGINSTVGEDITGRGYSLRFLQKMFIKYASRREEMRLLRSRAFSIVRKTFNRLGELFFEEGRIESPNDIYYLTIEEILSPEKSYIVLVGGRKKEYADFSKVVPPSHFSSNNREVGFSTVEESLPGEIIVGRPCTSGYLQGKVRVFEEYHLPAELDFDIIVTRHTDPGWTPLLGISAGLIIEHGGILSHAAIVSRELGIPTVIGVKNACKILKDNQVVELDGNKGIIKIISGGEND